MKKIFFLIMIVLVLGAVSIIMIPEDSISEDLINKGAGDIYIGTIGGHINTRTGEFHPSVAQEEIEGPESSTKIN